MNDDEDLVRLSVPMHGQQLLLSLAHAQHGTHRFWIHPHDVDHPTAVVFRGAFRGLTRAALAEGWHLAGIGFDLEDSKR